MDETTFKTLNALSVRFGRPTSINGLVGMIREMHESAYYKNIYEKVRELEKQGVIKVEKIGRNSEISLDFGSYAARDMLMEMEIRKKQEALEGSRNLQNILPEIEDAFRKFGTISSASMISPGKTIPLNRIELLITFRETPGTEGLVQEEMLHICGEIKELHDKRNMSIDTLLLKESEFKNLLKADEYNPLGEMVAGQIAFLYPQNFWALAGEAAKGLRLHKQELSLARIPEQDLAYNMERFGYREMGTEIREGDKICLECISTAALLGGNARRAEAVPVMLAKNRPNYRLLIFLSRKYNVEGRLLGLLKALNKINRSDQSEHAINSLEILGTREEKADEKSIREKMRLYHAY